MPDDRANEPLSGKPLWLLNRVRRRRAALMTELEMHAQDPSCWRESFINEAGRRFAESLTQLVEMASGISVEDETA